MICNPSVYDATLNHFKENNIDSNDQGRIVVNSSQYSKAIKQKEEVPLVGKIVFLKEQDIEQNEFERGISRWVANFHRKIAKYCVKKPRYSELRPMKFALN